MQDTGEIQGGHHGSRRRSVSASTKMSPAAAASGRTVDPAGSGRRQFVIVPLSAWTAPIPRLNSGRIQINLRDRSISARSPPPTSSTDLQPKVAGRSARDQVLYMQAVAGHLTVEDIESAVPQYQYSLSRIASSHRACGSGFHDKLVNAIEDSCRNSTDVATRPAAKRGSAAPLLTFDRPTPRRGLGLTHAKHRRCACTTAFGQRQVSTLFTQLNQYHVVLEVSNRVFSGTKSSLDNLGDVKSSARGRAGPSMSTLNTIVRADTDHRRSHPDLPPWASFPSTTDVVQHWLTGKSVGDAATAVNKPFRAWTRCIASARRIATRSFRAPRMRLHEASLAERVRFWCLSGVARRCTSCLGCCTRVTSTRSRFCRRCPRRGSVPLLALLICSAT